MKIIERKARWKLLSIICPGLREEMLKKQNYKCAGWFGNPNCDTEIHMKWSDFDHIIAYSRGGEDSVNNLHLLCPTCNRKKANKAVMPDLMVSGHHKDDFYPDNQLNAS